MKYKRQEICVDLLHEDWRALRADHHCLKDYESTIRATRSFLKEILGHKNSDVVHVLVKVPGAGGPLTWMQLAIILDILDSWGIEKELRYD